MKGSEEDRREFSRIRTRIEALMRRLDDPEAPQLFHETVLLPDVRNIFVGSSIQKEIADFLIALDAKLDTLVSMATRDQLEHDFPIIADIHEISGNGFRFHTTEHVEPGEYFEAVLFLSRMPLRLAGAVGVVRDFRSACTQRQCSPQWVIEFTRIREQDLDAVVQFVFQEERRAIREQKLYSNEK